MRRAVLRTRNGEHRCCEGAIESATVTATPHHGRCSRRWPRGRQTGSSGSPGQAPRAPTELCFHSTIRRKQLMWRASDHALPRKLSIPPAPCRARRDEAGRLATIERSGERAPRYTGRHHACVNIVSVCFVCVLESYQLPSTVSDQLMDLASSSRSPCASVFFWRSLPARSTMFSFPTL